MFCIWNKSRRVFRGSVSSLTERQRYMLHDHAGLYHTGCIDSTKQHVYVDWPPSRGHEGDGLLDGQRWLWGSPILSYVMTWHKEQWPEITNAPHSHQRDRGWPLNSTGQGAVLVQLLVLVLPWVNRLRSKIFPFCLFDYFFVSVDLTWLWESGSTRRRWKSLLEVRKSGKPCSACSHWYLASDTRQGTDGWTC